MNSIKQWLAILLGLLGTGLVATEVVDLPAGDIPLVATRIFGSQANGKIFRGAADGSTRFTGAMVIGGWTNRGSGVWGAKLPVDAAGKPRYFEQLFVNGRRAQRSRCPLSGFFRVRSANQYATASSLTGNRIRVEIATNQQEGVMLAKASSVELAYAQLIAHIKWDVARSPLKAYHDGKLEVDAWPMKSWNKWTNNDYYALENLRGAFVHPGQWFYDGVAGEVLYRPLKGEKVVEAVAALPGMETLVMVSGAKDVVFENVGFAFSAPVEQQEVSIIEPIQAAVKIAKAAVIVDYSTNVVFRNCRFSHLGNYGLWFREGCRGGGAFTCELTDLGAGGVRIGTYRALSQDLKRRPANCTSDVPYVETAPWMTSQVKVDDCLIAHGGRFHPAGVGVLIGHASDCEVVHNDIFDFYYTGVSVGWVWGYAGSPAQRNIIAFNHIYDIGQRQLADMGGIYLLGTAYGTCVSNNVVHGIHSNAYGGWGLYADEGSEGVVLENNLVYDTDDASFHQHYGKDNVLRNNILVDSSAGQVAVSLAEAHRSLTVERNLILWSQGDAFVKYGGTKSERALIDWQNNVWWRIDGKELFNGTSFADWRARVRDEGSVFADPKFVDWRNGDFSIATNSPALKKGFKPFDFTVAGRRK